MGFLLSVLYTKANTTVSVCMTWISHKRRKRKENCTSGFFQCNIHHLLRATPTDGSYGFPELWLTWFNSILMNWRLHSKKAVGLVGGWSLFRSPRPASPTDFLSPFFLVNHWSVIAIDWRLLISPPRATSGIIDIRRKCIEGDKQNGTNECRGGERMCADQRSVIKEEIIIWGMEGWHGFFVYFNLIQVGVASDWWCQASGKGL